MIREADPARLLILDAGLLLRQYQYRKRRGTELTLAQRRAWAEEAATVLEALSRELAQRLPADHNTTDTTVAWNTQFAAGQRMVTAKVTRAPV